MKEEIIYTDDYALIVSDEKIEKYDYVFNPIYKTLYQWIENADIHFDRIDAKKVIAHRPLTDAPVLEGVPLLPEFSQEDSNKELYFQKQVMNPYTTGGQSYTAYEKGFIDGYNKAKETHKYTEEDLMVVWNVAFNEGMSLDDEINETVLFKDVIKSLQKPKRPKYFETVCDCQECGANKTDLSLDMGCENKIATIINSKGQTELVGEYIYE